MKRKFENNRGIALVLVVSILAVMVSLVVAFLVSSKIETIKAFNFKESMKVLTIADAGIEHAKSLLKENKAVSGYDDYTEVWSTAFQGGDVDNDGDSINEAKWIELLDSGGIMYGRYAVTVIDEASKVNINSAGYYNEDPLKIVDGWSPFEVSLNKLFEALGVGSPLQMRDDILSYRFGGNAAGSPGFDDDGNDSLLSYDGADNDADGDIDEISEGADDPGEFDLDDPLGDDDPFLTIHDLKKIGSTKSEFSNIERYLTVFSKDKNISSDGRLRLDINHMGPNELVSLFTEMGVAEIEQKAANVVDYRDKDNAQTILVSAAGTFYGCEGIRINELLLKPVYTFNAEDHTNITGPGGNWIKSGSYFTNSVPEVSGIEGIWWFENIQPGTYYLKVYGTNSGQTVGDVKVGLTTHVSMKSGDTFVQTVNVGSDGRLKIEIANGEVATPGFTTYFYQFELSQQPDTEYIELINITNTTIDLSGWKVEGLRANDLIADIPTGTTIDSFDYLILAVDKNDADPNGPTNVTGNNISFQDVWSDPSIDQSKVIQLEFSEQISMSADILSDDPGSNNTVILLKDDDDQVVDRVKYASSDALFYRSIERDDPQTCGSSDSSNIFDLWNFSDGITGFGLLGTPTLENNNINIVGHVLGGLNSEVVHKNNYFSNPGELINISRPASWKRFAPLGISRIADYICVNSYRLEAEGNASSPGGWTETPRMAPDTNWYNSTTVGDEGDWLFDSDDGIINGIYELNVYGNFEEAISVAVKRADNTWTNYMGPMTPGSDNRIRFGLVDIGGTGPDATADSTLEVRIRNDSVLAQASFDYIVLSPSRSVPGRVNVNTASIPVLMSLPGVTATIAGNIYNSGNKPFGDVKGVGDILEDSVIDPDWDIVGDVYRQIANLITVQSDVYEIIVTAETFHNNKKTSARKVRTIVER